MVPIGSGANRPVDTIHFSSYVVTIPLEIIDKMKIRKGQKLVVAQRGNKIIIEDWK
jgi:hypothetical protein